MKDKHSTRAPKQFGDFGEGLTTYALIRKGFEVAYVDHVGADLIAEKNKYRIAVSVKSRMFRAQSRESRMTVFTRDHLDKLEHFAKRFQLDPVIAQVVCIVDRSIMHLFMLRAKDVRKKLKSGKHGFSLHFGPKSLEHTKSLDFVDYSCWAQECVSTDLFRGHGQRIERTAS
ncbi:MAG: hypothetical protein KDA44_14885 [Planctomycetales bacterium]|nr:hypothetical protein [Planctomycetales bacterium]